MAQSNVIIIDSDDESDFPQQEKAPAEVMECPICLQTCIHPAKLPCGHIFCFLCVKGVAYKNRRCAMCRRDIPAEFLEHPQLVYGVQDTKSTASEDGYHWFYEGRNGWWQYDERTCQEIEEAYKRDDKFCTILVAGYVYVVDFDTMFQQRQNDPARKRQVKRDLASTPKKGVAGLRIDEPSDNNSRPTTNNNLISISTIAATEAAIRITSNIIDSTLAHADEYRVSNPSVVNATGGNASISRRELLDEVEETLNISNTSSVSTSSNLDDLFPLSIDEFRSLALGSIVESSSDSENDESNVIL